MKFRALWAAVCLGALANALVLSLNAPRGDDITYLAWAVERLDTAWSPTLRPPPFPGWRPTTATWWWLGCGLSSVSGVAQQAMLAVLWLLALVGLGGWARSVAGDRAALWTAGLLLSTDRFRDLVTWRSWLTTVGELAFGGLALWALARERRVAACVLAVLAVWSKEPAAIWLAAAAWAFHRDWRVPLACAVAALPASWSFVAHFLATDPQYAALPERGVAYLAGLGLLVWPPVAIAVLAWQRAWFPLLAFGAAVALPLAYPTVNHTYLVEGLGVLAVSAGVWARGLPAAAILGAAAVGCLIGLPGSLGNARYQALHFADLHETWTSLGTNRPTVYHLARDAGDDARWLALRLKWELDIPTASRPPSHAVVPGLFVEYDVVLPPDSAEAAHSPAPEVIPPKTRHSPQSSGKK